MKELYLGQMSGTSADGIDTVLLEISDSGMRLLGQQAHPYSSELRQRVLRLCQPGDNEIEHMGELEYLLGEAYAEAALSLLAALNIPAARIRALGCHGQTLRHHPPSSATIPFTIQCGDPNIVAEKTGIATVADFRRRDMAVGGEGAPLVPAFHCAAFATPTEKRVIVNIGGIANITDPHTGCGFDTGPGNALMDGWIHRHSGANFDAAGNWAASGTVQPALLAQLLQLPYFQSPPPKSTGRELFNLDWLDQQLAGLAPMASADVQATLLELTATTILDAIRTHVGPCEALYVCGGGANNRHLMQRLAQLSEMRVATTAALGIDPQWVEAAAFAWLARQTLHALPGNKPVATGARREVILGAIYPA